mgnify:CR=1 FL=1
MTQQKARGEETTVLAAGPLAETKAVLPVGEFFLFAEIHDEAGAFATFPISTTFNVFLPDQTDYEEVDMKAALDYFTKTGDQARVSQILQADVSNQRRLKLRQGLLIIE